MKRFIPWFVGSHHRVENGQKLAHASDQGKLLGFSGGEQALVEGAITLLKRVAANAAMYSVRRTCALPPRMMRLPRSLPESQLNGATPTSAAMRRRSSVTELGQLGDKDGGGGRANAIGALQQCGQISMMTLDMLSQLPLHLLQLFANRRMSRSMLLRASCMADGQTLMLGGEHPNQLQATRHQRLQPLPLSIGQGLHKAFALWVRGNHLRKLRQHARIERDRSSPDSPSLWQNRAPDVD